MALYKGSSSCWRDKIPKEKIHSGVLLGNRGMQDLAGTNHALVLTRKMMEMNSSFIRPFLVRDSELKQTQSKSEIILLESFIQEKSVRKMIQV